MRRPPRNSALPQTVSESTNGRPKQPSPAETSPESDPGPRRGTSPGRTLITGGAGFIGCNLAERLVAEGRKVIIYDNLSRPGVERNLESLLSRVGRNIEVETADVRDAQRLRRVVQGVDAVFHFAAQVAVTTSLEDPLTDFEINAHGTFNVLEACRRSATPPKLLFTSTNKVYGNLDHVPLIREGSRYVPVNREQRERGIDETCPLDFHSPYGCSKGTADQYVLDYARCYRLPAVVFRMSCIYGPHQCGTEDQGWVAHFARAVHQRLPITIYGDGCQVRDLLYVRDLIEAMLAAHRNIEKTAGRAFNVGGGPKNAVSVGEVIRRLEQAAGDSVPVKSAGWRQGDQRYYVSCTRALEQKTGWTPRVGVDEGLERLYDWLGTHLVSEPQTVSV